MSRASALREELLDLILEWRRIAARDDEDADAALARKHCAADLQCAVGISNVELKRRSAEKEEL